MTVLEWLKLTRLGETRWVRPRLMCKDGFSMSVQAGTPYHYCTPREFCEEYVEVEIGFPDHKLTTLRKYAEGGLGKEYSGVYAYVPIRLVENIARRHGGVATIKKTQEERT